MNYLIIGYGSIGKRHADILKQLGCNVCLLTKQKIDQFKCFTHLEEALDQNVFDYIIVANPTYLHYQTLIDLIRYDYRGIVLVEKPLFDQNQILPSNRISKIFVAYNLRFHELLTQVRRLLQDDKIITFSAYVGQYLPMWRKDSDYRECYSAKKEYGGGVLRDLSHELDYSLWLCGPCLKVTAIGGRFSELEIDSDDVYSILMTCKACSLVHLHMNYLDRTIRREIIINTSKNTIHIDFVNGILSLDGQVGMQSNDGMKQSYFNQHQAMMRGDFSEFCSYAQGITVMNMIETIEKATISRQWITI